MSRRPAPRRVVVLVKRFPRLSETFILNEFLELRRQGLDVALAAVMDPGEASSQPEALALVSEVLYLQRGPLWREAPAIARALARHPWGALRAVAYVVSRHSRPSTRNLLHACVLVDRLAGGPPAHLHAHFMHATASIAYLAQLISGQSYSLTGHAKDVYTTLPENVLRRCAHARFVTTCTDANRRFLVEEIGVRSTPVLLCRHGVDLTRFTAVPRRPRPGRILTIGRLVPKKGFDVLIRACGDLARRGVDFELHLVGGGAMRGELEALAAAEGVTDRVRFLGSRPQVELLSELSEAEVFALAPVVLDNGDRDGIPNVLLEAMAAGVPVVAAAVSGIPEVVQDGATGRLVPEGQSDELAKVLEELLGDDAERARLAGDARTFALEHCDLRRAVEPLRGLFEASLHRTAGASSRP